VAATFTVSRMDGMTTASPTPDIFLRLGDSAAEVRRILAAVLAFSAAADAMRPEVDDRREGGPL
jgi:hypothetical protein